MAECSYCKKENAKMKIGPGINFCDKECYFKSCIKNYPGTSLAKMVASVRPDIAKELELEDIKNEL